MTRLAIADILASASVAGLRHLDQARVDFYRRTIDRLPPVVLYDTEEGLLLVDGYHRVAAAVQEGREAIEAEVRTGSRSEALDYAVTVGARQRGVPPDEIKDHIIRRFGSQTSGRSDEG